MFYGVEQSTDSRNQKTVIKKFSSEKSLRKWMDESTGRYTYECPESARNYHRTFRYGYEYSGRIDRKHKIFSSSGTPTYPRNYNDNLSTYLWKYGKEIKRNGLTSLH